MRFATVVLILLTGAVTQSCRIEMPSLVELIGRGVLGGRPYRLEESKAIAAKGGFKDTLLIGDRLETSHGQSMRKEFNGAGIPEENTVFFRRFLSVGYAHRPINLGLEELMLKEHEQLRTATRVAHIPAKTPFESAENIPRIQTSNILFVTAAGNMRTHFEGDRDFYNINNPAWNAPDDPERDRLRKEAYRAVLETHETGKVIAVTGGIVGRTGKFEPHIRVVQCGDIKETCFAVVSGSTSSASARFAAISFYLSQFWETSEEIVEVLKECALDAGEPGVDREFGSGVANLLHPKILKKEIEVVSAHLGETEEKIFSSTGGALEGTWQADNTVLQVYLPVVLEETLQITYEGTVNGAVEFATGNQAKADFTVKAAVSLVFLSANPIKAVAEDAVQAQGTYSIANDTLHLPENTLYTYTATADSSHLIKSLTLNEALALLPDPLGSMVDMASPDFFEENLIQIRMSFSKKKPSLVGDFNEDGMVAVSDFLLFVNVFGLTRGDGAFDEIFDLVSDGNINIADFLLFIDNFGRTRDS